MEILDPIDPERLLDPPTAEADATRAEPLETRFRQVIGGLTEGRAPTGAEPGSGGPLDEAMSMARILENKDVSPEDVEFQPQLVNILRGQSGRASYNPMTGQINAPSDRNPLADLVAETAHAQQTEEIGAIPHTIRGLYDAVRTGDIVGEIIGEGGRTRYNIEGTVEEEAHHDIEEDIWSTLRDMTMQRPLPMKEVGQASSEPIFEDRDQ
jgi:hypothetical protein